MSSSGTEVILSTIVSVSVVIVLALIVAIFREIFSARSNTGEEPEVGESKEQNNGLDELVEPVGKARELNLKKYFNIRSNIVKESEVDESNKKNNTQLISLSVAGKIRELDLKKYFIVEDIDINILKLNTESSNIAKAISKEIKEQTHLLCFVDISFQKGSIELQAVINFSYDAIQVMANAGGAYVCFVGIKKAVLSNVTLAVEKIFIKKDHGLYKERIEPLFEVEILNEKEIVNIVHAEEKIKKKK